MTNLILKYKRIFDVVHGDIHISNYACAIIDSSYFQRLRYLHQVGVSYFVFPNANHSRFEHSIGTYYLAGKILDVIKNHKVNEDHKAHESHEAHEAHESHEAHEALKDLKDLKVCELIKIAALCHDLGHGPFSHVFDDMFLPSKNISGKFSKHEYRSGQILESIIKSNEFLRNNIDDSDIEFIKSLINPDKKHSGFIYQIVSNSLNGLDIDKYDYLSRDIKLLGKDMHFDYLRLISEIQIIDNNIGYPKQLYYEIVNLFHTRYQLHKMVYNHKAVIAIQLMMVEIMNNLDNTMNITSSIQNENIDEFCTLTDIYLLNVLEFLYHSYNTLNITNDNTLNITNDNTLNITNAYNLLLRIKERKLYKLIHSETSIEQIKYDEKYNNKNIYEIYEAKIGYISGNKKNPLDNIYFYNTKDINHKFKINKEDVSKLIPKLYQEHILMIYIK